MKRGFIFMLLCMIGSGLAYADDVFERISSVSDLSDGDEIIFVNQQETYACGTTQNTNNRTPVSIKVTDHTYTYKSSDNVQVFLVKKNDNNYGFHTGSGYIYSASSSNNYLKTNTTEATTLPSGTSAWTLSVSNDVFSITNASNTNYYLAFNGTSYFSQYKSGQSKPYIYKKRATAAATALSVSTAPTKTNYKVGETLDLTGLVLSATVSGEEQSVTSGYTASPANSTPLNTIGEQTITFTYGGQTTTQTIHVGALSAVAIAAPPAKTAYEEGESFDASGMVVNATSSDGEATPTTWTEDVTASCTYSPATTDVLHPSNTSVTVSYTWGDVTKTAEQTVTVSAGATYTVAFEPETGTCATATLTEANYHAGVTLPAATCSTDGWEFAGWATSAVANTTTRPALYAAGETYYPTANTTLHAVYVLAENVDKYRKVTAESQIPTGSRVVIASVGTNYEYTLANNNGSLESIANFTPTNNVITCTNDNAVWTLTKSSGNYTIENNGYLLYRYSSTSAGLQTGTPSNRNYTITESSLVADRFLIKDASTQYYLEHNTTQWTFYNTSSVTESNTTNYLGLTLYVSMEESCYNSNPTNTVVTPTVEFEAATVPTLYIQDGTHTFTRTASVTGIEKTVSYSSSNTSVATVSASGVVTAVGRGTATITATVAAELGVNKEAAASYDITVKDASTIAGLKALTNSATEVSFTADLTDAVVTYVKGNYAYLQDATAAVMMNYSTLGNDIIAGIAITGAVSGAMKASNQIDCIIALTFDDFEEGTIPAAVELTLAQIKEAGTAYDGKLVKVVDTTVAGSLATTATSGASISDGSQIENTDVSFSLYAPNTGIEVNAGEVCSFTGFVSIYNGTTYRLNLYEQSQIVLTQAAPQDQNLSFDDANKTFDIVEGDASTYPAWSGQMASGADGTVTYSISGDNIATIDASTGAITWTGVCGTATVTATAAATSVVIESVTYPMNQTTQTYTITVRPRHTVTFYINGTVTTETEASYGDGVIVPEPPTTVGDYEFMGWTETHVTPTDEAPTLEQIEDIYEPAANVSLYAVYALSTVGGEEEVISTFTIQTSSAPESPTTDNGVTWTHSGVTFNNSASSCMPQNSTVTCTLPSNAIKAVSMTIVGTSNTWANAANVKLTDKNSDEITNFTKSSLSYNFTNDNNTLAPYTLTTTSANNAWIKTISIAYTVPGTTYSDYRSDIDGTVTITKAGFNTWYMPYAVEVGAEGEAFYVSDVDESQRVVLTKFADNKIPANTGAVIRAAVGATVAYTVLANDVEFDASNLLLGSIERTTVTADADYYYFVSGRRTLEEGETYQYDDTYKYGFMIPASLKNGNTFVNNANKAYLRVPKTKLSESLAKDLMLVWNNETTGISTVTRFPHDGQMYNLSGQKVGESYRGIVIVNGKKYLRK